MAAYIILKASSGDVPPLGQTGSADVYRGDHPTLQEAMDAAATALRVPAGTRLWGDLQSNLTRHITTTSSAAG